MFTRAGHEIGPGKADELVGRSSIRSRRIVGRAWWDARPSRSLEPSSTRKAMGHVEPEAARAGTSDIPQQKIVGGRGRWMPRGCSGRPDHPPQLAPQGVACREKTRATRERAWIDSFRWFVSCRSRRIKMSLHRWNGSRKPSPPPLTPPPASLTASRTETPGGNLAQPPKAQQIPGKISTTIEIVRVVRPSFWPWLLWGLEARRDARTSSPL